MYSVVLKNSIELKEKTNQRSREDQFDPNGNELSPKTLRVGAQRENESGRKRNSVGFKKKTN
jgi:hypothetical protein